MCLGLIHHSFLVLLSSVSSCFSLFLVQINICEFYLLYYLFMCDCVWWRSAVSPLLSHTTPTRQTATSPVWSQKKRRQNLTSDSNPLRLKLSHPSSAAFLFKFTLQSLNQALIIHTLLPPLQINLKEMLADSKVGKREIKGGTETEEDKRFTRASCVRMDVLLS